MKVQTVNGKDVIDSTDIPEPKAEEKSKLGKVIDVLKKDKMLHVIGGSAVVGAGGALAALTLGGINALAGFVGGMATQGVISTASVAYMKDEIAEDIIDVYEEAGKVVRLKK